jgi:hypothetical protein
MPRHSLEDRGTFLDRVEQLQQTDQELDAL